MRKAENINSYNQWGMKLAIVHETLNKLPVTKVPLN